MGHGVKVFKSDDWGEFVFHYRQNYMSFHVTILPAYTSHNRPVGGSWASFTMIVSSNSKQCIIHKCKGI